MGLGIEKAKKKKKNRNSPLVWLNRNKIKCEKSINPQVVLWTAEDTHYLLDRLELLLAPPWLDDVGVLAEAPPSDEIRPSRPNLPSLLSGASFRFSKKQTNEFSKISTMRLFKLLELVGGAFSVDGKPSTIDRSTWSCREPPSELGPKLP